MKEGKKESNRGRTGVPVPSQPASLLLPPPNPARIAGQLPQSCRTYPTATARTCPQRWTLGGEILYAAHSNLHHLRTYAVHTRSTAPSIGAGR